MGETECRSCGAHLEPGAHCRYCGQPGTAAPVPPEPARAPTTAERIAAVRTHPDVDELLRTDNVRAPFALLHAGVAAFGCSFMIVPIIMLTMFHVVTSAVGDVASPAPAPRGFDSVFTAFAVLFSAMPVLFICIGLAIAGWSIHRLVRKLRATLTAAPAAVLSRRTGDSGGRRTSSAAYHVGLEFERRRRQEFACSGGLYSTLRDDEVGVAITRGDELIAFRPV